MVSNSDVHAHVGAYILGALPDDEREEFETHLHQCQACQEEVRGLTETTALLGTAAAQSPPDTLRGRVMRQIRDTRQLPPPLVTTLPSPRRWLHRATAFAAAACLALAVVATGVAIHDHRQAAQLQAERRAAASVLSAPDVQVRSGVHTRYGTATLAASRERDQILFLLHDSRRLSADRAYQVWFLAADGTARSAGLLPATDRQSPAIVAGPIGDTAQVAVTVEPAAGSRQPTSKPIMALPLP